MAAADPPLTRPGGTGDPPNRSAAPPAPQGPVPLAPAERRLRWYLAFLVAYCAVGFVIFQLPVFIPAFGAFARHPGYLTNTAVKMSALLLLALLASGDRARFRHLMTIFVVAYSTCVLTAIPVLLWVIAPGQTFVLLGCELSLRAALGSVAAMEAALIAGLWWFARAADRARMALRYLSPAQFRALEAVAEVVVHGSDERIPAEAVARNVDVYLSELQARSKWMVRLVLLVLQWSPLISLPPRPPLSFLAPDERLAYLDRRFHRGVLLRWGPRWLRAPLQAMIRFAKQLSYLGYYNDPRTYKSVGYTPFSGRPPGAPRPAGPLLRVEDAGTVGGAPLEADVVIIGSGAAGAILAHELACTGKSILMLERGPHVERREITEDEARMFARLYSDGALQLTRDYRFQVLQGQAVGGSTMVNNAVCIDPPPDVLDAWKRLGAGLDVDAVLESVRRVRDLIGAQQQDHHANPIATAFAAGASALGLGEVHRVDANIAGCRGCGYCNIGCAFGAKLAMTERVLPDAQARARQHGGDLRIVPDCEVRRLARERGRVEAAHCRIAGRPVRVKGKSFIVAAGAIASSLLLLRSGLGGRNVGRRLSFNIGAPMTAVFPTTMNAYDGLQISHYLELDVGGRCLLETWWNPPAAQSLVMPGWFNAHFDNMRRYARMGAVGVLMGSEPAGTLYPSRALVGLDLNYTPSPPEIDRLLRGLALAGAILLEGGATTLLPPTFEYVELGEQDNLLDRLRKTVRDASDLNLNSGHPQGGNALSDDDAIGVVRSDFAVRGAANLFLCDASIFPSALGVNPQLAVMALAHYAAPCIAPRL
jgi:choline dehydrogenase-like flavoprotein